MFICNKHSPSIANEFYELNLAVLTVMTSGSSLENNDLPHFVRIEMGHKKRRRVRILPPHLRTTIIRSDRGKNQDNYNRGGYSPERVSGIGVQCKIARLLQQIHQETAGRKYSQFLFFDDPPRIID